MQTTIGTTNQVTLQQTQAAMDGLKVTGKYPSGKLAFWNACLSTRNRLDNNCRQGNVMRTYVDRPLPINRDELHVQLGAVLGRTLNALYEIEKLWNTGIIHFNAGSTFEDQSKWRDSMAAAIPGMGMKTISFALHIYSPDLCQLLTIDTWHLQRLGVQVHTIKRKQYLACEAELRKHCEALQVCEGGGMEYAPITLAACLWFRMRGNDVGESHAGISCYV